MNLLIRILQFFGWRESIETRLVAACSEVGGLKKEGDNGQYKYLRMSDIADALRGPLFSRGLVLIANDVECHEPSSLPRIQIGHTQNSASELNSPSQTAGARKFTALTE
jgi:hypothetical protein